MRLSIGIRFTISVILKANELMPWHPPTTDRWPIGQGTFSSPSIKISGWNVNGYRSIMTKGNLTEFMKKCEPDFMCLNETKIDFKRYQQLSSELKNPFKSYFGYWNFCKIKSGYSGVAIFAKQKPMNIIEDFPSSPEDSNEGRVLTLEYKDFFIISIYKPNSGMDLLRLSYRTAQYDTLFNKYVQQLMVSKPVVIFGDMNVAHQAIDIARPKGKDKIPGFTIQQRSSFSALLEESKLVDTYRHIHPFTKKYTWWTFMYPARAINDGWRLDYILSDHRLKVEKAAIHNEFEGSDHCPVSAIIKIKNQN